MNKEERGIIKWLPFNSLTGQKKIIDDLLKEKQKIKKPILSPEQLKEIEEKVLEIFYEQREATFKIYKKGYIITQISTIQSIDYIYKKIKLENNTTLFFTQILDIMLE